MSLTTRTASAVIWNFIELLFRRGFNAIVTLILAYFLAPDAFGVLAVLTIFVSLGTAFVDAGLRQALIRLEKISDLELNTAYLANILLSILAYVIIWFTAPFLEAFYEFELLATYIRVISFAIIFNSFQLVPLAILSRALAFKEQMKIILAPVVVSGTVSVYLAANGLDVWAMIIQVILNSLLLSISLYFFVKWKPKVVFAWSAFKELYAFGYKLFLANLLQISFSNMYVLVVARVYDASTAGLYYFASQLKNLVVTQVVSSIQNVTYPSLSLIQSDDKRLINGYSRLIGAVTFILTPIMVLMGVFSSIFVDLILGDDWSRVPKYLLIMCMTGILYPLHAINLNILKVKGRSDYFLYAEVAKKIISVCILAVTFRHGIFIILYGQLLSSIIAYGINVFFSYKATGYGARKQFKDWCPQVFMAVMLGGVLYLVTPKYAELVNWLISGLLFVLYVCVYVFLSKLFGIKAYIELSKIARLKLSRFGNGKHT